MKKSSKYLLALALTCTMGFTLMAEPAPQNPSPEDSGESVPDSGATVALLAVALAGTYLGSRFVKRNK